MGYSCLFIPLYTPPCGLDDRRIILWQWPIFGGYTVFQMRYSGGHHQIFTTAHLFGNAACMNQW